MLSIFSAEQTPSTFKLLTLEMTSYLAVPDTTFSMICDASEAATRFFFDNFASARASPIVDFLRNLYYKSSFKAEPAVDNITSAIALSSFANLPDMTMCKAEASRRYQKALKLVGEALNDPIESRSDATLLSVILMGMYEGFSEGGNSSANTSRHGQGAIALVKHRGHPTDMKSGSYRLFSVVRGSFVIEAASKSYALNEREMEDFWFSEGTESLNPSDRLYQHAITIPALRQRAADMFDRGAATPSRDRVALLFADARIIDTKLLHWSEKLPPDWNFSTTIQTSFTDGTATEHDRQRSWCGIVHSYPEMFIAGVFNNYRMFRIFIQSVAARCLWYLSQDAAPSLMATSFLHRAALHTVRGLIDDIAASVPAHLGQFVDPMDPKSLMEPIRMAGLKSSEA